MSICPCDQIVVPELHIPAGLNALPRQIRAFPEIRRALLAAIPQKPALREWRARNSQDLGLLLIDMWAYVSDVLAFYDERIANEEYIRTAVRRPSLRRLVGLLGYVPSPGQAAFVTLAALAEGRTGFTLPAGTAFRSDAFGTEPPQVFELSQDTPIHPLRNEWTIGPQQTAGLSQPTPSLAALGATSTTDPRRFLVFDTNNFGLARDRLVVVTGAAGPQPSRVKNITPFGAKDGKTYVEVELAAEIDLGGETDPSNVSVQVPTVSAVVTKNPPSNDLQGDTEALTPGSPGTAFLDSIYRQIHQGDQILVVGATAALQVTTVDIVRESTVSVFSQSQQDGNGHVTQTTKALQAVTKLTLHDLSKDQNADNNQISFSFAFVKGGTLTTVGKTELAPADFSSPGASITGIVTPPPDATASNGALLVGPEFLLADLDKNGVDFQGTLRIDAAGRATLTASDTSGFPSSLRTPITAFGNLVVATRGESVNGEVLGSGDPTVAGQQFKLKKKPLTYVPANNDVGRTSTLRISVDGVQWREVGSFFNCGPQSQVYTVRFDDDQNAIIAFGDGVNGARLSAGVGNVIASYRFGSGAAAPPAGAIQQIARSVIGLRAVRSPVKAFPGKDPDTADQIRQAAPRTALLFKRLVSTEDFEGYASFYAGVVKAAAEFVWNADKQQPGVAVTVIGDVDTGKLRTALIALAEQSLIITVAPAIALPMDLTLNVEVDPTFNSDDVLAAVVTKLTDPATGPLAPAQASIGGQFLASPLYETVQDVPGVVSLQSAALSLVFPEPDISIDANLGADHVVCVPAGTYFDFVGPDASITTAVAKSQGAASASREKGC
jgi:predicted phage baseplate assembly protein